MADEQEIGLRNRITQLEQEVKDLTEENTKLKEERETKVDHRGRGHSERAPDSSRQSP
jgi:cell shape-determining protein MreC